MYNKLNKFVIYILFLDPVEKVTLASSNLSESIKYWNGLLGLDIFEKSEKSVTVGFDKNEAKLELLDIGKSIDLLFACICMFHAKLKLLKKFQMADSKWTKKRAYGLKYM